MKPRKIVIATAGVIALLSIVGYFSFWYYFCKPSYGPNHVFILPEAPKFLTEDLALTKAQEAMAMDGHKIPPWRPYEDKRTFAPDGRPDMYLLRSRTNEPNRGHIMFVTEKDSKYVELELRGKVLACRVATPN